MPVRGHFRGLRSLQACDDIEANRILNCPLEVSIARTTSVVTVSDPSFPSPFPVDSKPINILSLSLSFRMASKSFI